MWLIAEPYISAFDIESIGLSVDIFLRCKNDDLLMLEMWPLKERLLSNCTPSKALVSLNTAFSSSCQSHSCNCNININHTAHIQQGPLSLFGVFLIDYKSDTRLTNEGNYSAVVSVLGRVFPFNKEKGRKGEANACVCVCERNGERTSSEPVHTCRHDPHCKLSWLWTEV